MREGHPARWSLVHPIGKLLKVFKNHKVVNNNIIDILPWYSPNRTKSVKHNNSLGPLHCFILICYVANMNLCSIPYIVWYTQSGSCNESKHVQKINDIMQYLCNNGYSKWWGMRLGTHWLGWHNDKKLWTRMSIESHLLHLCSELIFASWQFYYIGV